MSSYDKQAGYLGIALTLPKLDVSIAWRDLQLIFDKVGEFGVDISEDDSIESSFGDEI